MLLWKTPLQKWKKTHIFEDPTKREVGTQRKKITPENLMSLVWKKIISKGKDCLSIIHFPGQGLWVSGRASPHILPLFGGQKKGSQPNLSSYRTIPYHLTISTPNPSLNRPTLNWPESHIHLFAGLPNPASRPLVCKQNSDLLVKTSIRLEPKLLKSSR